MSDREQHAGHAVSDGPPWAWRFFIKGAMFLMAKIFRWDMSARVHGPLPAADEPVVVVANHTSYVEPFLVAHAVWRLTGHWMQPLAKAELFRIPVLGTLARWAGAIPVERESQEGRASAYSAAIERLEQGGAIYIAPEGTCSHDGELLPLRHGAARLALEAGCRVIVVTHFGGQRAWSPVAGLPHRGAPFDVAMETVTPLEDEDASSLTGRIAATMLDRGVELRTSYAEQDVTAPWWPPYSEPAEPTRTARENLEEYREAMAEAIDQARDRMAELAAERDLDTRMKAARDRARVAADNARHRAADLGEQLRHRADELVDLARSGQLGDELRHRAEELSRQARLIAEHASELREELREVGDDGPAGPRDVDAARPVDEPSRVEEATPGGAAPRDGAA